MDKKEETKAPIDVEKEKTVLDLLKQLAQKQEQVSRLKHARNVRKQKDKITGVIRKVEAAADNYRKGKELDSDIDSLKKALATLEEQYETGLKGFEKRRQDLQVQESSAIAKLLRRITTEKIKLSAQAIGNLFTSRMDEGKDKIDRIQYLDTLKAKINGEDVEESENAEYSDAIWDMGDELDEIHEKMAKLEEEEEEFKARDEWSVDRLELALAVQSNEARRELIPQQNRFQRFVGFIVNKFSALRKNTPKQLHANIQGMIDTVENVNIPSAVELAGRAMNGVKEWTERTAVEVIAAGQSWKMDIIKKLESKIQAADQEISGQESGKKEDDKNFADLVPDEEAFL